MKLIISDDDGTVVDSIDGIEGFDLSKPFAQSHICSEIGRIIDSAYRLLQPGELKQVNDEAYTWADPECTELGWVKLILPEYKTVIGEPIDDNHVPVRRRV